MKFIRIDNQEFVIINLSQDASALKGWECFVTVKPDGWNSDIVALQDNAKIALPALSKNAVIQIEFYDYYSRKIPQKFIAKIPDTAKEVDLTPKEISKSPQKKKTYSGRLLFLMLMVTICCYGVNLYINKKNLKRLLNRWGEYINNFHLIFNQQNVPPYVPIENSKDILHLPVFQIGDSYQYESKEEEFKFDNNGILISEIKKKYRTNKEVVPSLDADQIVFKKISDQYPEPKYIYYDLSFNLKIDSRGHEFIPPYQYFKFNTKVDAEWFDAIDESVLETDSSKNGTSKKINKHKISGKVELREKIEVTAGMFDTWKIILKDEITYYNGKREDTIDTSWYAPEIKNSVKSELETKNAEGKIIGKKTVELIDYSPKK